MAPVHGYGLSSIFSIINCSRRFPREVPFSAAIEDCWFEDFRIWLRIELARELDNLGLGDRAPGAVTRTAASRIDKSERLGFSRETPVVAAF
jgi:hypothetical protein